MKELTYQRPTELGEAIATVASDEHAEYLAGGTNLVDHLKLGLRTPTTLVDVRGLGLDRVEPYEDDAGTGLRVGANVPNSDLAATTEVRRDFPVVARALLAGASGQIRNQATTAGNLLQRTRCVYFQDITTPCNKREPGTGCSALEGYGRYNAILGASDACVATHPSDLAVALAAVDARVRVEGPEGSRHLPITELYRLPGDHPERDTVLDRGELITAIELPHSRAVQRSTYRKVRDRASYAFALVSVAAAVEVDEGTVRDVRIAWGGVAHQPWRARIAEQALIGSAPHADAVRAAVDEELEASETSRQNAYKLAMLRHTTAGVLGGLVEGGGPR